jgi:branched-subunit amino acid transport protein
MYGLGDSGNVCDTTSKMFNAAACNKLYVPATTPTTLTAWLNTNSTMVVIGAVAFFALMIVAKGGR